MQVRVVGESSLRWAKALEAWGALVEAVVVNNPDSSKDIRGLVTSTTTTTSHNAYLLQPIGPWAWDSCMFANLTTTQVSEMVATLFKQGRPAIVVLSVHASLSRNHTLLMLPSVVLGFYQKTKITLHHTYVRGITSL